MITDPKDKKGKTPKSLDIHKKKEEEKKKPQNPPRLKNDKKHSVGDDNEKMKETEVTADPENVKRSNIQEKTTNTDNHITNKHHGEQANSNV
ncbi:MAG: hypothetical protein ACK4WD_03955 [Flavobacteriales bacterium]|jgi:hypothetical protein